jgi:2-polyprenyl-3-methyl-5-hydroxy-6-metoxy-1,4-benzoquinol methylase
MEPPPTIPSDGPVLDVDGSVVPTDVLVSRVEDLIRRVDAGAEVPGGPVIPGLGALVDPVHALRILHREMHPPEIVASGGVRGRVGALARKSVRRMTSWYVEPRFEVQEQIEARTVDFASETYNAIHRLEADVEAVRRQNVRVRLDVVATGEKLRRQQAVVDRFAGLVAHLEVVVRNAADQDELRVLAKEFSTMLDRLGAETVSGADVDYVEFERRFRGDPAHIAAAQRRYLTLFPGPGAPGRIVDIGCGRGEMLAMLAAEGHDVLGVDMDAGMVEECLGQGLDAVHDDGIHFLAQTQPDSLKGVFCAQVVEHLLTSELEALIRHSFAALGAEGALVMETINPRSSYALGNHFYADTSHVRPVHPETLRFLCEQAGFSQVLLEERSPHPALELCEKLPDDDVGAAVRALLENVFGYQDYVVVAVK